MRDAARPSSSSSNRYQTLDRGKMTHLRERHHRDLRHGSPSPPLPYPRQDPTARVRLCAAQEKPGTQATQSKPRDTICTRHS